MKTDARKWSYKKWDAKKGDWSTESVTVERDVKVPENFDECVALDGKETMFKDALRGRDIRIREDNRPDECTKPGGGETKAAKNTAAGFTEVVNTTITDPAVRAEILALARTGNVAGAAQLFTATLAKQVKK